MKRTYLFGSLALLLVVCLAAVILPTAFAAEDDTYTFAVLSTTDMHGRSTLQDAVNQQRDINNIARAATTSKSQRNPLPFTDVDEKEWYYEAVYFVCDQGMMNGMGNDIFYPEGKTTRAQIAAMIHRLCGASGVVDILTEPFDDVCEAHWFCDAVAYAYNGGVINGLSENIFGPDIAASRQDMITMLFRMMNSAGLVANPTGDLSQFADGDQVSAYARDAMSWAVGEGLIVGIANADGELELCPLGAATRAQLATIIMRFMGLEFKSSSAAAASVDCQN